MFKPTPKFKSKYAIAGGAVAAVILIFITLAQTHVIVVPFFSPTALHIDRLKEDYSVGEDISFAVRVEGYGSNCHMLQVEILNEEGERASFYRRADDCRIMTITHGQYDMIRSFDYDGHTVLATPGLYRLHAQFEDLEDGHKASTARTFMVNPE